LLISFAFWLGIIPSFVATSISPYFALLIVVCFLGFLACVLYMLYAIRCPNCRSNLGYAVYWPPSWGVSDRIKFCPFCGIRMDTDEQDIQKGDADQPL